MSGITVPDVSFNPVHRVEIGKRGGLGGNEGGQTRPGIPIPGKAVVVVSVRAFYRGFCLWNETGSASGIVGFLVLLKGDRTKGPSPETTDEHETNTGPPRFSARPVFLFGSSEWFHPCILFSAQSEQCDFRFVHGNQWLTPLIPVWHIPVPQEPLNKSGFHYFFVHIKWVGCKYLAGEKCGRLSDSG